MQILFWVSLILILHGFIFYPISLYLINKFKKTEELVSEGDYEPEVSFIIAAHNEEDVIKMKLENTVQLNYPGDKLEVIVASDNSDDDTNKIVEDFIENYDGDIDISLYIVKESRGKTNA